MATEAKKKLTPAQWAEVEVKWKSGEYTLSALEEEYGLRTETFSRYFKKHKITKGSDSTADMIRESLKSDTEQRARARAELADKRRSSYDSTAGYLSAMALKQVQDAVREGKSLAAIEDNMKTLQRASAVLSNCFNVSSRALGLEKEESVSDEIPNLVFGELTQAQVKQLAEMDEGQQSFDEEISELEKAVGALGDDDEGEE